MNGFQRISIETAQQMITGGKVQLVDIRDEQSWGQGRINGALHLTSSNLQDFLLQGDPDLPVIVYCYHGNSSQGAAALLHEKGFEQVFSMDGGFEQWRSHFPIDSSQSC